MSVTMSDDLSVPFTVIKPINQETINDQNNQYRWQATYDRNGGYVYQIDNIQLIQDPIEYFNMEVKIGNPNDAYGRMRSDIKLSAELRFPNYLHEFNQNYKYQIICKSITTNVHLFDCSVIRCSECVKYEDELPKAFMDLDRYLPGDVYFCIRRLFNGSNDMRADNDRMHRALLTLRNTGCDVVLRAKDGDLHAHSSILSTNSEVFQVMLSLDMKEKHSGIINVPDVEGKVVSKMLDYLYTGKLGELGDMTESLFKLAHRYQLLDLCRRCEEYYIFNVRVDNDNIVEILNLTELYGLKDLKECAMNFTKRHEEELSSLASYREHLIESINSDNVVARLLLSEKYNMEDVKMKSFNFIKDNYLGMIDKQDFLNLFESHGRLMQEIHVYVHKNK